VKRTHLEQTMQRSLSSTMRSDSWWYLVALTFGTVEIDGSPL